jgi:rhodanese-related sulfurtransferase
MLASLAPLSGLPAERLRQLAEQCVLTQALRGVNPLEGIPAGCSAFLVSGELLLVFSAGGTEVIVGGTEETCFPLHRRGPVSRAKAITAVTLLLLDEDMLDIVLTWDQVAAADAAECAKGGTGLRTQADWGTLSGVFSVANLSHGAFARLPPAHIEQLLRKFERVAVHQGDVVVREGDEGDYYYVAESGRYEVDRFVGGVRMRLAELKSGDAFGEEALVADAVRNASVTAASDGSLLRLAKRDFVALLKAPLLKSLGFAEAGRRVSLGAVWLDVRYPSEYQYDRLPGAINVPLNEVRNMAPLLDRSREYVVYCQTGRRSSAAAFLLSQHAFDVSVLDGGLRSAASG